MSNSPITQIPLQLEEYFLKKLDVEWREPSTPTTEGELRPTGLRLDMTYEFREHVEISHSYQMVLTISGEQIFEKAPNAGARFVAIIVGRYRMENANPDKEPYWARLNGVSLLYSTFRGIFGTVTGSFEHGKIDLPSIDPRVVVKQVEGDGTSAPDSNPPSPVDAEKN